MKPGELETIADLADPKFKGRICTRSGKHVYNVALIASVIAHEGEEAAEQWLAGVRDNLARKPQGNDRAQAKGIYEGVCDVAISNHYYMGKMATNEKKPEQKDWANAVNVQFLDQSGRGNHVNISGAAVIKGAKNRDNAVALLEFLAGDTAQNMYATVNFEFPVKDGIKTHELVESWGAFQGGQPVARRNCRPSHGRDQARGQDRVRRRTGKLSRVVGSNRVQGDACRASP